MCLHECLLMRQPLTAVTPAAQEGASWRGKSGASSVAGPVHLHAHRLHRVEACQGQLKVINSRFLICPGDHRPWCLSRNYYKTNAVFSVIFWKWFTYYDSNLKDKVEFFLCVT